MYCRKCGKPLNDTDKKCPKCGEPVKAGLFNPLVIGLLAIIAILTYLVFNPPGNRPSEADFVTVYCEQTVYELKIGERVNIPVTVSSRNGTPYPLKWSSSNPSVITVENGFVTALAPGKATVSCKVSDLASADFQITVTAEKATEKTIKVREITYEPEGALYYTTDYEYDAHGNLIRELIEYEDGSREETAYSYNSLDQLSRETRSEDDNTTVSIYEYDEKGLNAAIYSFLMDGSFEAKVTLEYDGNGRLARRNYYYTPDEVDFYTLCSYDSLGRLIGEKSYQSDDTPYDSEAYQYDAQGRMTRLTAYDAEGLLNYVIEYEFDREGNITGAKCLDEEGELLWYDSREYRTITVR